MRRGFASTMSTLLTLPFLSMVRRTRTFPFSTPSLIASRGNSGATLLIGASMDVRAGCARAISGAAVGAALATMVGGGAALRWVSLARADDGAADCEAEAGVDDGVSDREAGAAAVLVAGAGARPARDGATCG